MIELFICDCGGSENLIRQSLHKYGYKDWAMKPIKKGKTACLNAVEALIRRYPDRPEVKALFAHINNNGKWCVIFGADDTSSRWSDISRHDMKSDIEAEAIIEHFA